MDNRVKNSVHTVRLPILISVAVACGMLIGSTFFGASPNTKQLGTSFNKFREVLGIVENDYVDTIDPGAVTEVAISQMLEKLDPHSSYIPLADLDISNASLESDFEGIGVEFIIHHDTVQVVSTVKGGPADIGGILPGDRIISASGSPLAGPNISNKLIFKKLRGRQGSVVSLEIIRKGVEKSLIFPITRSRISSKSVEAAFLLKPTVGYLKISRFSDNTFVESQQHLADLKKAGAQSFIIDVRDNPGGYLDRATRLANEFLPENKLMVYTEGKARKYNQKYYSNGRGTLQNEPLIVLVNEGSASASEILAGAIQDNDRGLIVGRRTYGKGLVQVPLSLKDGSELRLTISRYYTPSGRCIQKPYKENPFAYNQDLDDRFERGELFSKDSVHIDQSAVFETPLKRKVYGGGGVLPDVFVPLDSQYTHRFLVEVIRHNLFREFAMAYKNKHSTELDLLKKRADARSLLLHPEAWSEFVGMTYKQNIEWPYSKQNIATEQFIMHLLKAYVAQLVWGDNGFYQVLSQKDPMINKALHHLNDAQKLLLASKKTSIP